MNKARRKRIASVIHTLENIIDYDLIESAKDELENILYEEEDAYDNMPENLQYSMRGEESSEAIDNLQEAVDLLEEAIDTLNELDDLKDEYNNSDDENDKNNEDDENDEDENEKSEKEAEMELKEEDINERINEAINSLEDII